MTSLQPQFILISGGYNQDHPALSDVERYDSLNDRWESLPDLNQARNFHSSCTLGKTLYVMGGNDNTRHLTNSIEKLENIDGSVTITTSQW